MDYVCMTLQNRIEINTGLKYTTEVHLWLKGLRRKEHILRNHSVYFSDETWFL